MGDDVTSGENVHLGWILRNIRLRTRSPHSRESPSGDVCWRYFRSKDPNRADIAQLPVAHARASLNGTPWSHVTFGHFRYYWTTYCTTTLVRKNREKRLPWLMIPVRASSGHVTSGDVIFGHVTSGHAKWSGQPGDPPKMRLEPSRYTTDV